MNNFRESVACLWTGALLLLMSFGTVSAGPVGSVGDIYVISHWQDGTFLRPAVLQYDGETGDLVGPFATAPRGNFMGMTWGPNGNLFLTLMMSTGNWQVREYEGQTGEVIRTVVTYTEGDYSIAKGLTFGPDGDLYVGNFWLGNVTRFDGTTFEPKAHTPLGEIGSPSGMLFAPSGELLVISGGFNEVRRYQVHDDGIEADGVFASTTGSIQAQDMTFGPNGNLFVAMGTAGGVFEYDGSTGVSLGAFVPFDPELRVNGLAFDNFGRLLVAAIYPLSRVDAYDAATGEMLGPFLTDGLGGSDAIPTLLSIKPQGGTTGIYEADHDPIDIDQFRSHLSVSPNPFRSRTSISFSINRLQTVELFVVDMTGRRVATLVNRELEAGDHRIDWERTDPQGALLASGVYWVRMNISGRVSSEKVVLLR